MARMAQQCDWGHRKVCSMRAAAMYTLIVAAKLNNVDPQAWLAELQPLVRSVRTGSTLRQWGAM